MDHSNDDLLRDSLWYDPTIQQAADKKSTDLLAVELKNMSSKALGSISSAAEPQMNYLLEFYNTIHRASKSEKNEQSRRGFRLRNLVRSNTAPVKSSSSSNHHFSKTVAGNYQSSGQEVVSSGAVPTKWKNIPDGHFQLPVLRQKDEEYLIRKATETAQVVIERGRSKGGSVKWIHIEKYKNVQIYQGKTRSGHQDNTVCICGVTRVPGTIKDVASLLAMSSTRRMRQFSQVFPEFYRDAMVLYNLKTHTKENNWNEVSAKWMVVSCPPPLRPRDFCYLECQDRFVDSYGRKGWVLSMHSINIPGCQETLTDFGYQRGSLYQSGIIVTNSEQPYYVDVLHIVHINMKNGDAAPYRMLRERVACISRIHDVLRGQRLNEQRYLRDLDLIAKKARSRCCVCQDPFHLLLLRKLNCRKCGEVVCGACSKQFDILSRQDPCLRIGVRICLHCYRLITTASADTANLQKRGQKSASQQVMQGGRHLQKSVTTSPFLEFHDDVELAASQTRSSIQVPSAGQFQLCGGLPRQKVRSLKNQDSMYEKYPYQDDASALSRVSSLDMADSQGHGIASRRKGAHVIEKERSGQRLLISESIQGMDGKRANESSPWSIFDRQHRASNDLVVDRPTQDLDFSASVGYRFTNHNSHKPDKHTDPRATYVRGADRRQQHPAAARLSATSREQFNSDARDYDTYTKSNWEEQDQLWSGMLHEEETKSAEFKESTPAEYAAALPPNGFSFLQCDSTVFSSSGISSLNFRIKQQPQHKLDADGNDEGDLEYPASTFANDKVPRDNDTKQLLASMASDEQNDFADDLKIASDETDAEELLLSDRSNLSLSRSAAAGNIRLEEELPVEQNLATLADEASLNHISRNIKSLDFEELAASNLIPLTSNTNEDASLSEDEGEMGVDSEVDSSSNTISSVSVDSEDDEASQRVQIHQVETTSALEYHV